MSKLTKREKDLGWCEEAQTYCSVAEERYKLGRADAIEEVYKIVTDFLIKSNTELDFNLALQDKILDLKYKQNS